VASFVFRVYQTAHPTPATANTTPAMTHAVEVL
jgi:hypothetical protein